MDKGIVARLKMHHLLLIGAYTLSVLVTVIVFYTGGTNRVFSHLMYVPIAIVASAYGKKAGVLHGIISGFLIGPFMPLYVSGNVSQDPVNWIIRLVLFSLVSLIIGTFSDYNKKNQEHISEMLTHDTVTRLRNIEAIRKEDIPGGSDKTIVVLTVKDFEDTMRYLGYNFSNIIIGEFVRKISEIVDRHGNAELYRHAGMQFILIISKSTADSAADTVLKEISQINRTLLLVSDIPIYIEIQMGITEIKGTASTIDGLRQAFIANSYAKANDLDSIIYDASLEAYYRDILGVASSFSASLANKNIGAAYQYVYSAQSEEIHGVEMLARWRKNDNTYIRPDFFIPIIEKTNLMHELTGYMITCAVEFLTINIDTAWRASINFSRKDFSEETMNYLIYAIKKAHISPSRIVVEITESCLLDMESTIKYLKILRECGIRVAIDDFGKGYASYQYVSELPIDTIKIDKSIILKIDKNAPSKSLAKGIVDFCRENNIKTLAEGVETREIADVCKEIGIDYLQGYFFHKPQMMENS